MNLYSSKYTKKLNKYITFFEADNKVNRQARNNKGNN